MSNDKVAATFHPDVEFVGGEPTKYDFPVTNRNENPVTVSNEKPVWNWERISGRVSIFWSIFGYAILFGLGLFVTVMLAALLWAVFGWWLLPLFILILTTLGMINEREEL